MSLLLFEQLSIIIDHLQGALKIQVREGETFLSAVAMYNNNNYPCLWVTIICKNVMNLTLTNLSLIITQLFTQLKWL